MANLRVVQPEDGRIMDEAALVARIRARDIRAFETFYKAKGVTWKDGAPLDQAGRDIYFCHWAGGGKSLPTNGPFDAAWKEFAAGARQRLRL